MAQLFIGSKDGRPKRAANVIVKWQDGQQVDINPAPLNARTRVHEYGGGAVTIAGDSLYYSNFDDQRLYRQSAGGDPEPVTPSGQWRYADGVMLADGRMICVREDHTVTGGQDAVNSIVLLSLDGQDSGTVLATGYDFYASPCVSPDGTKLAWLSWNHPNMPWDGTELWLAELHGDGTVSAAQRVAGGQEESIYQPAFAPDGTLHFVSDRTDWWNLYRWWDGQAEPLCPMAAEFGVPQWFFGSSRYGFESASSIICTYTQNGVWHLARLDTKSKELTEIPLPYSTIGNIVVADNCVVFTAGHSMVPASLIRLDLQAETQEIIAQSSHIEFDEGYLSVPVSIEFPTADDLTAHAFYYAPYNQDYVAPDGELPPLIVLNHGGPTDSTSTILNLGIQYWTSRGFAVVDVNYGGSTGYGRAYRLRLNGRWGIVDVEDCINAAKYLAEQGKADGKRLAIRGGSAGGYTTLAALTFHDIFSAGASHFGVSDLEALTLESHKFESRYLDNLIGPYPERKDIYVERSPIHFSERINCPLILFQGLEDKVVPPNQAERMFDAVKFKEIPVAYLPFAGEQHGFRRAENIKRTLDAELYFYSKVFKFGLADKIEPIQIENLDT